MHAAVVTTFDAPPAYREFPNPTPQTPDDMVVDVIASGRIREHGPRLTARTTPAPVSFLWSPVSTGWDAPRTARCATSSYPTPPWARWPSRPSSTNAAASPRPSRPVRPARQASRGRAAHSNSR